MTQVPPTDAVIRAAGPWTHRDVAANTARFHLVEAGEGPLVIFLHGFPLFWWTWREHIQPIAEAGYRVVAMDLRGYGGSDHTPHGYDPMTLAADVNGIIRALGETDAIIVGHGWGGLVAWSVATMYPESVNGIVPISMPHPADLRKAILKDVVQRRAMSYVFAFQLPFYPEHQLTKNQGELVEQILRRWSGTAWPDSETAAVYRAALLGHASAHCALEYHRWALRSIPRSDGRRFQRLLRNTVHVPVLHIHGELDSSISPRSAAGAEARVSGKYEWALMPAVGHFPHEEAPERFREVLLPWLQQTVKPREL